MARAQKTTYVTAERTRVNGVDQEAVVFLNGNVWHYRLTFDGGKNYMRGTTKCREQTEAVRFARELFFESRGQIKVGATPTRKTFGDLCDDLLALRQRDFAAGQISQSMLTLYVRKHKVIKDYFGRYQPVQVTADLWDEFVRHRLENGKAKRRDLDPDKRIGLTTIEHEKLFISQVLSLAASKHLIPVVPKLRIPAGVKRAAVTRGTFTEAELERIVQAIHRDVETAKPQVRWNKLMLQHWFMIMLASGMRTNDALLLRWRDVRGMLDSEGQPVAVLDLQGKGKKRSCITNRDCYEWLEALRRDVAKHTRSGDLVFAARSGQPYLFARPFKELLEKLGMRGDAFGKVRTPYSLRHVYAMVRVNEPDTDLLLLARNMGTSVRMIEKHYASHISVANHIDQLSRTPSGSTGMLLSREVHRAAQEVLESGRLLSREVREAVLEALEAARPGQDASSPTPEAKKLSTPRPRRSA
jgi:integrase